MLPRSLAAIDEAFLRQLCESECPESQTLDFKRELPGKLDQDKHELCKDVVALANAEGGDLVYGIEEKDGVAGLIVGITTEPADVAIRRINQVLDAGIEPRIHGLRMQHIPVSEGYVLILQVPASYDGPHCIRTNGNNKQQRRFVMRNGTMVSDMSYDQIRAAFDRTATLAEQARHFIATRRELIAKKETPVRLKEGPKLVIHLVPISGLAGRIAVDLRSIYNKNYIDFKQNGWSAIERTFNIDGLVIHPYEYRHEDGLEGYNYIFRTGAIEGVAIANTPCPWIKGLFVDSLEISNYYYQSMKMFAGVMRTLEFSGPALFGLSILKVEGHELVINNAQTSHKKADRQHLVPSEVWIEDIDTVDIDSVIRPLLDTLWQAFGIEHCPYFDDATGKFAPRR